MDLSMAVAIYGFLPRRRIVEQAGIVYEADVVRAKLERGEAAGPVYVGDLNAAISLLKESAEDAPVIEKNVFDPDDEAYLRYVKSLDTGATKEQDHYIVLGLSNLRYKATKLQIKQAYRQKSLNHHPDKRKHDRGKKVDDDYFICINSAYNQLFLSDDARRAFDSVDPTFDEDIPENGRVNAKNFFRKLAPVFDMNSRFSNRTPVPKLGDKDADRNDVEHFYDFWFSFDSWREFSYLDKEDKKSGGDKWERKQIEKDNKVEREKMRKADVKRVRTLVELAYAVDPRIQKFKDEDKQQKEQVKEERRQLLLKKKEDERLAVEEEKRKLEEQEQLQKAKLAQEKKLKDQEKKVMKQAQRGFRRVAESAKYWAEECYEKQMKCMQEIERICLSADKPTLLEITEKLAAVTIYDDAMTVMNETCKKVDKTDKGTAPANGVLKPINTTTWTVNENQLLIKANATFPPGTVDRWLQIANFVNEHRTNKSSNPKSEKDVIKQTKAVQNMEFKPVANQNKLGTGVELNTESEETVWTVAEQKKLEDGLTAYPSTDPERWEKIAALVGSRNKKDCVRRFKKLVQMRKEKKAQAENS